MTVEPSVSRRLEAVVQVRRKAAAALERAFPTSAHGVTEATLHRGWTANLRSDLDVLDGWYQPPPSGVSVLIGEPPDFGRINFDSLRTPSLQPREDLELGPEDLLYLYSSPVDRETAMIGDFGMTIYRGSDPVLREHVASCFAITASIVERAAVGMRLGDLYRYAEDVMHAAGKFNDTSSRTDRSGEMNIGHTVPWSYGSYDSRVWEMIAEGNQSGVCDVVSRARRFVAPSQELRIESDFAFTVEPQIRAEGLPKISFHTIVLFKDGVKSVCAQFGSLLAGFGMLSYLPPAAVQAIHG